MNFTYRNLRNLDVDVGDKIILRTYSFEPVFAVMDDDLSARFHRMQYESEWAWEPDMADAKFEVVE